MVYPSPSLRKENCLVILSSTSLPDPKEYVVEVQESIGSIDTSSRTMMHDTLKALTSISIIFRERLQNDMERYENTFENVLKRMIIPFRFDTKGI